MKSVSVRGALVCAGLAFIAGSANAQPKGVDPKDVYGAWYVLVSTDKMTDRKSCNLGYWKGKHLTWLDELSVLHISYRGRGGVEMYQYRIGTRPAEPERLANRYEKAASVIDIPLNLNDLGDAQKIVVGGITVLRTLIDDEIELDGIQTGATAMRAACKGTS
jgi:hypothetical protein